MLKLLKKKSTFLKQQANIYDIIRPVSAAVSRQMLGLLTKCWYRVGNFKFIKDFREVVKNGLHLFSRKDSENSTVFGMKCQT